MLLLIWVYTALACKTIKKKVSHFSIIEITHLLGVLITLLLERFSFIFNFLCFFITRFGRWICRCRIADITYWSITKNKKEQFSISKTFLVSLSLSTHSLDNLSVHNSSQMEARKSMKSFLLSLPCVTSVPM